MDENDWTARFVNNLGAYLQACGFQEYEACNTTSEGLNFESFQKKFSDLQGLSPAYIFQGSPDVLIKGKDNFIPLSLHCDIRVIEMGQKLNAKDYTAIPEKMGELSASMHWLLVAHVLKAMTSGYDVSCVCIKGLLLDKMLESGIQCEAEGRCVT